MPNTPVVAATEGLPIINRRKALTVAGGAVATALAVKPAPAAEQEVPWVKARRLARELSETLAECDDGQTMAQVWPADGNAPHKVLFCDNEYMLQSGEARLNYHAKGFARAAKEIEPDATDMWIGRGMSDNPHRFQVVVARKSGAAS